MTPSTESASRATPQVETPSGLAALLEGAGISRLDETGWIRATGEDRVRWLNGMVTNSVQQLQPGDGSYSFLLSAQGRIQGDATIFAGVSEDAKALLMETATTQVEGLMALLDRYIIMDDVELADISAARAGLLIAGPTSSTILNSIGITANESDQISMRIQILGDTEIRIVHAYSPLVPRFEIWAKEAVIATLQRDLLNAGAVLCNAESLQWLRALEGTPLYSVDIRDRELPQETGQTRALHFNKGCYLGQEIVERIRSRGNVHREFSGFLLEGELPPTGTALEANGKAVGELTSVVTISLPGESVPVQLGLGYIRRDAVERGAAIDYPGGTAVPVSLPFSPAAARARREASE